MWRGLALVLIVLAFTTTASAQLESSDVVALDRVRVRAHLAAVEASLRATDVSRLTDAQRAARDRRLDDLHGYWLRGEFPHGRADQPAPLSPTFIDEGDRPCAMAWLVMASGHEDVAREIARDQNHAYVPDITHPALRPWLEENGLTVEEAARVQPTYCHASPDPAVCECIQNCLYDEDAGPAVCSAGFVLWDMPLEAFWSRCAADCADAAVTGPAVCNASFECECTDGGLIEDASSAPDAGAFDAGSASALVPSGGGLCSVGSRPAGNGWFLVLVAGAVGLRRRRARQDVGDPSARPRRAARYASTPVFINGSLRRSCLDPRPRSPSRLTQACSSA